jgi:hypothetical protein
MGVVNTTNTFQSADTITSAKLNNIIDETTFTSDAIQGSTLQVTGTGKLAVSGGGITSNELATNAVTSNAILNGAVTQEKTSNMLLPSGAVMAFAMNSAPSGWLAANGDTIPNGSGTVQGKTENFAVLYSLIGTTYGSAGKLPDLRGYFVRGHGENIDGTTSNSSFGEKKADTLQNITGTAGRFQSSFAGVTSSGVFTLSAGTYTVGGGGSGAYQTVDFDASRVARTSTETAPRNISLLYCIKI